MAIASEIAAPTDPAIGSVAETDPQATTPVLPEVADPASAKVVEPSAKPDEALRTMQSQRDTARAAETTLKAQVADLETKLAEASAKPEHLVSERDMAWEDWLFQLSEKGYTLAQARTYLENNRKKAGETVRAQQTRAQAVEGIIALAVELSGDDGFGEYLRDLGEDANITQANIPAWKKRYLAAGGKPSAAVVADPAAPAVEKAPPIVPQPGGAAMPDAPAYQPGMRSRDLFKKIRASGENVMSRISGPERIASTRG